MYFLRIRILLNSHVAMATKPIECPVILFSKCKNLMWRYKFTVLKIVNSDHYGKYNSLKYW